MNSTVCRRLRLSVMIAWALFAVVITELYGFLNIPSWVAFDPQTGWSVLRAFIVYGTLAGGVVCAVALWNRCK